MRIKVGYTVTTAGVTGAIKSIDLRKSRIIVGEGKLHVVPNKATDTANLGGRGTRRG